MTHYLRAMNPQYFATRLPVVDEEGNQIGLDGTDYSIRPILPHNIACIHHCYTRSREDCEAKQRRGRADTHYPADRRLDSNWAFFVENATHLDESIFIHADATRHELALLKEQVKNG